MKAAVLHEFGAAAVVEELELRQLRPHEVRVRIAASGVCHTDLSIRDGSMPALLPSTLGHEGAGVVVEVGAAVTRAKLGDHVVLSWVAPCRKCFHCLHGDAHLCVHGLDHGFGDPYADGPGGPVWPAMGCGTLAEETLLPEAAVLPITPELPLEQAALLGCGVLTGVGAVVRTAHVRPGETVLVLGCGGVGLAAVQGARLSGAARIIAADPSASARERALGCGATHVMDPGAGDVPAAVRDLTDGMGVDHGIEVVGLSATIRAAYDATRRGGIVTVVGAGRFDDDVRIPALSLMADAKQIRGSVFGSTDPDRDLPPLVDLALRGGLDVNALVTRRIGLADVESAFEAMTAAEVARSVVIFG
jgi:S-(hydroxymethyl)glutathione dehydrogenase / alcohol dehydrogenase